MKQHFSFLVTLFFISFHLFSQNYCINLTKEKKLIVLKEGKVVTYSLLGDSTLQKARIDKIMMDSITFYLKKEQQYKTIAINEVGVFAYTKKSFWIALPTYYLAMGLMSAASNGAAIQPFDFVEPKSFRQNMKVEDGWKAIIFECSKK